MDNVKQLIVTTQIVTIYYQIVSSHLFHHVTGALTLWGYQFNAPCDILVHWEMSADHETTVVYQTYIDEQEMATTRHTIQCTFSGEGREGECACVCACVAQ